MAPQGLPMPPRMVAANMGSRRSHPMMGWRRTLIPRSIPPAAASPAPRAQVQKMTRSMSMPETLARSRLSAVALMDFPSLVRVKKR